MDHKRMGVSPRDHHRRSIRLQGYDYTLGGAYFITIAAYQRQHLFGEIQDGQIALSTLGMVAREEWFRSAQARQEIMLYPDEFIVMPNHIHGIVWIQPKGDTVLEDDGQSPRSRRVPRSLGSMIAGYKSAVTGRAKRELGKHAVWQRNYYEHIIRDEAELGKVRQYIRANPERWEEDQLRNL